MADQDRKAPAEPPAEQPKAEQPKAEQPKAEQPKAEQPKAPRKSDRRVYGRSYRSRLPHGQQYIFVGLALLFLIAWLMFRDSCSRRLGETFGVVTNAPAQDAGSNVNARRPRPMRPPTDPDDW